MDTRIDEKEKSITIIISGTLQFQDHPAFNDLVDELAQINKDVSFDLSKLERIDSAGIGMLFLAHKMVSKSNKKMTIKGANGQVKRVFDLTDIGRQIKIV